jgi:hypothetical protein
MIHQPLIHRTKPAACCWRRATTMLEVIVSLSLLMSALSLSLPLIVQHGRLLIEQRNYRLALDELSNQLDRLSAANADDLPGALRKIAVSPFTAERLHNAKLASDLKPTDVGLRLTLKLTWKNAHEQKVALAAWIVPHPNTRASTAR